MFPTPFLWKHTHSVLFLHAGPFLSWDSTLEDDVQLNRHTQNAGTVWSDCSRVQVRAPRCCDVRRHPLPHPHGLGSCCTTCHCPGQTRHALGGEEVWSRQPNHPHPSPVSRATPESSIGVLFIAAHTDRQQACSSIWTQWSVKFTYQTQKTNFSCLGNNSYSNTDDITRIPSLLQKCWRAGEMFVMATRTFTIKRSYWIFLFTKLFIRSRTWVCKMKNK